MFTLGRKSPTWAEKLAPSVDRKGKIGIEGGDARYLQVK